MRHIENLIFMVLKNGRPLYGWLINFTAIINLANELKINLVMYGEDGEAEYGGVSSLKNSAFFDINFTKKIYLSNEYTKAFKILKDNENYWWKIPNNSKVKMSHWSYFENWDSYRNFVISKKYMGYEESKKNNVGTYTNFGQNDTSLYDLHCYLMYLKFVLEDYTRHWQDIRRGAMTESKFRIENL